MAQNDAAESATIAAAGVPEMTDDQAPPSIAPKKMGELLTLIVTNHSTVPGRQYFSVVPPPLTIMPPVPQKPVPKVSNATVRGGEEIGKQATDILQWLGGPDALAMIVLTPRQPIDNALRTQVRLGDTVHVSWANGGFAPLQATSGIGPSITVTFGPDIPAGSSIGLVVGPGPILVPIGPTSLVLTPDLAWQVIVEFGTPNLPEPQNFRDISSFPKTVVFDKPVVAVTVGLSNLIVQNG